MNKILLIDDDKELCQLLGEFLTLEGFTVSVVHDGESGLAIIEQEPFSAIILDVMLPQRNGFEVLKALRKNHQTPVLMLTAKGDTVDRVIGLEIGADDYMPKPCDPRELVARIRAILRRARAIDHQPKIENITLGPLTLQLSSRHVVWDTHEISLTGTEFNVLEILVRRAGKVISKDEMTEQALNRTLTPYDRSIDVHVSNIRKKLTAAGANKELIINVRGAGYMFILENAPS